MSTEKAHRFLSRLVGSALRARGAPHPCRYRGQRRERFAVRCARSRTWDCGVSTRRLPQRVARQDLWVVAMRGGGKEQAVFPIHQRLVELEQGCRLDERAKFRDAA